MSLSTHFKIEEFIKMSLSTHFKIEEIFVELMIKEGEMVQIDVNVGLPKEFRQKEAGQRELHQVPFV